MLQNLELGFHFSQNYPSFANSRNSQGNSFGLKFEGSLEELSLPCLINVFGSVKGFDHFFLYGDVCPCMFLLDPYKLKHYSLGQHCVERFTAINRFRAALSPSIMYIRRHWEYKLRLCRSKFRKFPISGKKFRMWKL